jgi:uncharacterized membrane protein YccC
MTKLLTTYRAELRLVVRSTLAVVVSLAVSDALGLPQGYWAALSALIIVQVSLGGTIAAGLDRLAGTLAGAVAGALVTLAGQVWNLPQLLVLAVAVAPLSLLAAIRPSFRVAPITAAIVLLATPSNASPFVSAIHRVAEIAIGTIIGVIVSVCVFPLRARQIAMERCAETLKALGELLMLHLEPPGTRDVPAIDRLNERVFQGFTKLATAAGEARREHAVRLIDEPVPERLVRTLRRLRSDVAFVGRATADAGADWPALAQVLGELAASFRAAFDALAESTLSQAPPPDFAAPDEALAKLTAAIRQEHGFAGLPFVIETLRRDLGDLGDALKQPSKEA